MNDIPIDILVEIINNEITDVHYETNDYYAGYKDALELIKRQIQIYEKWIP